MRILAIMSGLSEHEITDHVRRGGGEVLRGDGRQVGRQVPRSRRRVLLLLVQEGDLLQRLALLPLLKVRDEFSQNVFGMYF